MPFGDAQRPLYEIKANLFKGLAHPYRIRILEILSQTEEASVAEMLEDTGLEASHLSKHLAVLRRYELVRSERRASTVTYRLAFPEVSDLLRSARQLLQGILHLDTDRAAAMDSLPEISAGASSEPAA